VMAQGAGCAAGLELVSGGGAVRSTPGAVRDRDL
ncbi:hypothetical protein A2U01_0086807, partial [Trifolium medium]|nr:hypothetical protein [Trifolium medium]